MTDLPSVTPGEIIHGRRSITADTDLRLCRFFGLSEGYWLRAQAAHDTEVAQRDMHETLAAITPWANKHLADRSCAGSHRGAGARHRP